MQGKRLLYGLVVLALLAGALARPANSVSAKDTDAQNEITAELVGQVYNSSPAISAQYGYVNYLKGLAASAITGSGDLSEHSALLTFYNHTVTERVINNGPMRVIDRTGEATFYFDTTPDGDFSHPETLRDGTAVMAAALRMQVVIDTLTGAFTAHFDCTIARTEPFTINGTTYRLGKRGQQYQVTFFGHLNQQAPPSAYIAGFITGLELHSAD